MQRAVVVICDGHRADMVSPALCPAIAGLTRTGQRFMAHRSVFPSVTRTSSASIATGCHPGRHGLHGNAMGLPEADGYTVRDVGHPAFRDWMRAATGRTLKVPTLAERLRGDAVVFSNVSPGAAYFQDPDGHGFVYHRDGSFAPGLQAVAPAGHLEVSHDATGDRAMTERFCREVLRERRPALALLWLCEPDHTMHANPLGSPAHLDAIAAADACVALVEDTVSQLRAEGEDVLFMVGSDHGQETVERAVALDRLLVEAGLKHSLTSTDVAVAGQGTSGLIYLAEGAAQRLRPIADWLAEQDFIADLLVGHEMNAFGHAPEGGLAIAFSMRKSGTANGYGVPGLSDVVVASGGKEVLGVGQHGGLGRYEQAPFLIVTGSAFGAHTECHAASSIVDIAPTVLAHLGRDTGGMDGGPLQDR